MDLSLSERQQMLKTSAREFMEKEYPWQKVQEVLDTPASFTPETQKQVAGLGWTGLPFPEDFGGAGGDLIDLAVLLEEIGRGLLPVPYTSTVLLCGLPILQFGTARQKKDFLPRIASGASIMAFAFTEASSRFDAEGVRLKAARSSDGLVLNGTKLFVRDANIADHMLVVARTSENTNASRGLTLLLVDARAPGITVTKLRSAAMDRQCEVVFSDVHVPTDSVLGKVDEGWPIVQWVLDRAVLAECIELVGGLQKVLEMSVEHAKRRVQFGKPIGSFQAIQFKCADMVNDVDGARFITYYALWKLSEGMPCRDDIARAKIWVSDASRRVVREGQQIHAGIGFIKEVPLYLYFRRAKTGEIMYGDADHHRQRLADFLLR